MAKGGGSMPRKKWNWESPMPVAQWLSMHSEDVTDVLCLSMGTTKREPSIWRRVRLRDPRHVTAW